MHASSSSNTNDRLIEMLLFAEREELEWDGDIKYEIDELRSELSVRLAITLAILFYCILTETIMKKVNRIP